MFRISNSSATMRPMRNPTRMPFRSTTQAAGSADANCRRLSWDHAAASGLSCRIAKTAGTSDLASLRIASNEVTFDASLLAGITHPSALLPHPSGEYSLRRVPTDRPDRHDSRGQIPDGQLWAPDSLRPVRFVRREEWIRPIRREAP